MPYEQSRGPIGAIKDFAHHVNEALKMDKSSEHKYKQEKQLTPAEHALLAEQAVRALEQRGERFSDLGSKVVITKIEKA